MDFDNDDDEQKGDSTPDPLHAHHVQEQEISGIAENETTAALANDTDVDEKFSKKLGTFYF